MVRTPTSTTGSDPARLGRPRGPGTRGGFTLVELTVVLMIVAVVASLTVPQVLSSLMSVRLRTSAQDLLVAANRARDFATTRRRICRLVLDLEEQTYQLEYQAYPQQRPYEFVAMKGGPIKLTRLANGVKFVVVEVDPAAAAEDDGDGDDRVIVAFQPTGGADAAIIQITDERRTYSLLIDPGSGRATLVDQAVDELPTNREDLDA